MRILLLSLITFFCLSALRGYAQPVLDSAHNVPIPGDGYVWAICNGWSSDGSPGASQVWDLTGLQTQSHLTYMSMSSWGTIFPVASILNQSAVDADYFQCNADSMSWLGHENNGVVYAYGHPEVLLHFPFTYLSSFSNTWSDSFDNGLMTYRVGSSLDSADGYGILKLPNGTYSNVLRVKYSRQYTDSVPGLGITYTYNEIIYRWFQPGIHQALATISHLVVNGAAPIVSAGYLSADIVADISGTSWSAAGMLIYPNPSNAAFYIQMTTSVSPTGIHLYDLLGNEMDIQTEILDAHKVKVIPNSQLQGSYQLRLQTADGRVISRAVCMGSH